MNADPARATRMLPHNLELEASVLGGVITRPEMLAELPDLETDDFYHWPHRIVWEGLRALEHDAKPIDVVLLDGEITKSGRGAAIGGMAFLGELVMRCPTPDNVRAYSRDLRLLARNRKAILALSAATERAYSWQHDPAELITETAGELARLEQIGTAPEKRVRLIDVPSALEELASLATAPVYETPFPTLNEAIGFGGLLGTQAYTLAAGTGRGKTSFIAAVAQHTAMQGVPVLVISYEMKPGYIVARKAAGLIGTHSNEIIRGRANTALILRAMPVAHLFFLHKPSLADVRTATAQLAQKFGTPPLVIVDYLQKLAEHIARGQARPDLRLATSEASDILVDIADRNACAVLSVSAISRGSNRRATNPRKLEPYELVDVAKESGAVEYDGAGLIVLSLSGDYEGDERVATITLAKARFGRELHIDARYNGRRGDWRDCGEASLEDEPAERESPNVIRMRLALALKSMPARNPTELFRRVGGNKKIVLEEIRAMKSAGLIAVGPHGLETPTPTVAQVDMGVS